jgi:hypothetical protein
MSYLTPATWARAEAELPLFQGDEFAFQPEDERTLARLDQDAQDLGFDDQKYFVEANRALAIPVSFEADKELSYGSFYQLDFKGTFKCYSKVMIGRIIGASTVRAYCLAFDEVLLLPDFDQLPEDRLLYVPILAIESMHTTL